MFIDLTIALLRSLAANPAALTLAIIVATFALEDVAAVAVGLLVSQMALAPWPAVPALLVGTILGDLALHVLGRAFADTPFGRRVRSRGAVIRAETWLRRRSDFALALARFVPGLRFPIYVASGFIGLPTRRVAMIVTAMSVIWTPVVFWLSISAGSAATGLPAPLAILLIGGGFVAIALAPRVTRRWLAF